ncbi:hypothetical protein KN248_022370 [Mycobacterium paraintracellulare]|uniref:hypothetical protein n=1 Tax=Mycobacterium paraintracellulare TaxID=1138383 RepID=UPI001EEE1DA8|nr:hypothetical protein [Mycobacterium paraintracellulare]WVL47968.1 hypothetical protein KN248_022370 [Mycobacterium paraintracellulare]
MTHPSGVTAISVSEALPLSAWAKAFDTNVLSIARSLRTFLLGLLAQGRAHIINTASTSVLWPFGYDRLRCAASKARTLALIEATEVGGLVVDAIKDDTFFLTTRREAHDIVRKRADDIDAFVTAQIAAAAAP